MGAAYSIQNLRLTLLVFLIEPVIYDFNLLE